jgi:hypothetical protein
MSRSPTEFEDHSMSRSIVCSLMMTAALIQTTAWSAERAVAATTDPLVNYYTNTLTCRNEVTKAICRVWLNRDGQYFAFYNLGAQAKAPDINGPFQINGRTGTWTVRPDGNGVKLCLWVAAPRTKILAEQRQEMYSEATCYPFTPHKVGDKWTEKDLQGRELTLWLTEGR